MSPPRRGSRCRCPRRSTSSFGSGSPESPPRRGRRRSSSRRSRGRPSRSWPPPPAVGVGRPRSRRRQPPESWRSRTAAFGSHIRCSPRSSTGRHRRLGDASCTPAWRRSSTIRTSRRSISPSRRAVPMPGWPRPSRMPPDVHEHAALRTPQRSSGTGRECSRRPMTPTPGGGRSKPGSAISRRGTPTGRDVLLEEVVARLPAGRERAVALTRLAWVSGFGQSFRVSADLFRDALAEIGDDPAARIEIEWGLAWSIHETGDVAAAEPHARAALELAERLGEPGVLASALADMAFFQTIRGRGIPTALIERALELEDTDDEWRSILGRIRPAWVHGMLLEWAGDLDAARSTLTRASRHRARARRRAQPGVRGTPPRSGRVPGRKLGARVALRRRVPRDHRADRPGRTYARSP